MPRPATDPTIKLYEGNFDKWIAYTTAIFIKQGKPHQVYPAIQLYYRSGAVEYYKSTLGDIRILLDSISEHLLNRIPSDLELGVGPLYACLEELRKPFRLFDLPAELRVKIYEEVIPPCEEAIIAPGLSCDNPEVPPRQQVPALAHASKQLRQEALPVYFSSTTFYFTSGARHLWHNIQNVEYWQDTFVRDSARFLRAMDVVVPAMRGPVDWNDYEDEDDYIELNENSLEGALLEIRYHGLERGVQLKAHPVPALKAESKEKLAALAAGVNMEAKKWGLKGDAVLLMLNTLLREKDKRPESDNWLGIYLEDEDEDEERIAEE